MGDFDQMLRDIGDDIQKLIGQRNLAKEELSVLSDANKRLELENEGIRLHLKQKEEFRSAEKIGDTITATYDLQSSKKKLTEIIREIDQCIKLLDD